MAEPADAAAFTDWTCGNPQIDPKDAQAGLKKNNPTAVCFAVEDDKGKVVAFAPAYCQLTVAHLAFNPESDAEERKEALQWVLNGLMAFAVQFGIREITMTSKEKYPVAKWAVKHGFEPESRQLFLFNINKVLVEAEAKDN
jgi:ABC-type amino acid transport substrate-binding protein